MADGGGAEDLPPHDLQAEAAVLAACMLDERAIAVVVDILEPDRFWSESHRRIYEACASLHADGQPVDVVQVSSWLRAHDRLQQVGGNEYLVTLLNSTPGTTNVASYARVVAERWRLRRLHEVALEIATVARQGRTSPGALVEQSLERLSAVALRGDGRAAIPVLGVSDLSEPLRPLPWLVEALGLAPGPPVIAAGYGYSRKTLAWQAAAVSVAAGASLWGVWRVRRGRALHLDYEQGRRLTQERYQRLARGLGIELADLPEDALSVACLPAMHLDARGAELALSRACEGMALVLVDSYRAACPGTDENSSEARAPLDVLARVSERTGACIVVVHHAKKPQQNQNESAKYSLRGSSSIFDACSGVFVFDGEKGKPTKVSHEKERNRGTCVVDFGLDAVDVPEPHGRDPKWGLRVVHLDPAEMAAGRSAKTPEGVGRLYAGGIEAIKQRIVSSIRSAGKLSKRKLRYVVFGRTTSIDQAIAELLDEKLIHVDGSGPECGYVCTGG